MKSPSLRVRFLLILTLGAIVPLAIVGVWLNSGVTRAGRALLQDQLRQSFDNIAASSEQRWAQRSGEIGLLASNVVVTAGLQHDQRLSAADSQYLATLVAYLRPSITKVTYTDVQGRVRWSFGESRASALALPGAKGTPSAEEGFSFTQEVVADGAPVGQVSAQIALSSIFAMPMTVAVPGAVAIVQSGERVVLSSSPFYPPALVLSEAPAEWERVQRIIAGPRLTLTVAAPAELFVAPFARVARRGGTVLMSVAVLALLIAMVMTTRVTRSLRELMVVADRVAAGELSGPPSPTGDDEVGKLGQAFNAMTSNLQGVLSDLSQQKALAAVGEFAAMLSHEVRNGLTAVRVDLQHASLHMVPEHAAAPLVERALGSVQRLNGAVTGALQVARMSRATREPVQLREVLERAMFSAQPSFSETRGTLAPLDAQQELLVEGDAIALEQLFLNLLLNAAQSLSPGGHACVSMTANGPRAEATVTDSGRGIALEEMQQVGRPYRSRKPHGTGLGLPIATRIAEAHRGSLVVTSELGAGTTVTVSLPLADARVAY